VAFVASVTGVEVRVLVACVAIVAAALRLPTVCNAIVTGVPCARFPRRFERDRCRGGSGQDAAQGDGRLGGARSGFEQRRVTGVAVRVLTTAIAAVTGDAVRVPLCACSLVACRAMVTGDAVRLLPAPESAIVTGVLVRVNVAIRATVAEAVRVAVSCTAIVAGVAVRVLTARSAAVTGVAVRVLVSPSAAVTGDAVRWRRSRAPSLPRRCASARR
jgi:hypothetical protein